jgi:hypothetical protein
MSTQNSSGYVIDNMPMVNENRNKQVHIPLSDVDDLPFKNRQDPNFIASISKKLFYFKTIIRFKDLFIIRIVKLT